MSRGNQVLPDCFKNCFLEIFFLFQIEGWRHPEDASCHELLQGGSSKFFFGFTQKQYHISSLFPVLGCFMLRVFHQPDDPDQRSRVDCFTFGFVVEADIPSSYRQFEALACFTNSCHRFPKLPEDFRFFWISEIQTIRQSQGPSSGTGHIPCSFGNRDTPSGLRIEFNIP